MSKINFSNFILKERILNTINLSAKRHALKITFVYFIVGSLWILLSDKLVEILVEDKATVTIISIAKGWFYVVVSALLIFSLVFTTLRKFLDAKNQLQNINNLLEEEIAVGKRTEKKLIENEEKYRLLTEYTSDVIWVLNLTTKNFTYVSPSIMQLLGYTPGEMIILNLIDVFTPESLNIASENISKNAKTFTQNPQNPVCNISEYQQISKNGDTIWVEVSSKYRFNINGDIEAVGVSRNIDERKRVENEVLQLSYHDQLTGVYNRRYYEQEIQKCTKKKHSSLTLVMADVNGLKLTNDAFGHKEGDILLVKIANILQSECRENDVVARIGGDEFVLLLPDTNQKEASRIVERIYKTIEKEKTDNAILSVSIGFAVKQDDSDDMNEVFMKAEDDMYRHKLSESSSMRSKTIEIIMNSLFEKNNREVQHSKRVSEISEEIAINLKFNKEEIKKIRIAGLMHDIGKIGIPDNILNKVGKLNTDEWSDIKRHSEVGYRILSSVNEFSEVAEYVLEHHERWDGKGYPKGLKEKEISLQARIIAVADAYDAMTSNRTYRNSLSDEDAVIEIKKHSGYQFDPVITKVFIEKVLGKEW